MAEWLTPSNITFIFGLLGIMFAVYSSFRDPQVSEERKAALLAQQVNWTGEATERRFVDMGQRISDAMTLAQNHIHTVDTKVESLNTAVGALGIEVAKLSTIIEERIPRKI